LSIILIQLNSCLILIIQPEVLVKVGYFMVESITSKKGTKCSLCDANTGGMSCMYDK